MEYLLGIDMGTSHIKAALFTLQGQQRSIEVYDTPTVYPRDGWAEYDPEELWGVVQYVTRRLTGSLCRQDRILSVAVASMAEAGLLVDSKGSALTPVISWFDSRGKEMVQEWTERFGPERTFAITGLNADFVYSLLKILWIKKHQPDVFRRAHKWLCVPDYINYRLTGEPATDFSIAGRTMAFDILHRRWSQEILEAAGLRADFFAPAYQGGTAFAAVSRKAAAETGLEEGTPVAVGGHDHICGALSAGVIDDGTVLNSLGTAEGIVAPFTDIPRLDAGEMNGFNVGCHVARDRYCLQGGLNASGLSLSWFAQEFGADRTQTGLKGMTVYDLLSTEARQSSIGAKGLIFIPHLRGAAPPKRNPNSTGVFFGIRDYHRRREFVRAVLEGLSCEFAHILRAMSSILGIEVCGVYAIGGGARNELWMEIKAALVGKPVLVPALKEATLLGAALLGGIGAGVYPDEREALNSISGRVSAFVPEPECVSQYSRVLERYLNVAAVVEEIEGITGVV